MKKIIFDKSTFVCKTKLNLGELKKEIIDESVGWIENFKEVRNFDNYAYKDNHDHNHDDNFEIKNKLDLALKFSLETCKNFYSKETHTVINSLNFESWINVVKSNGEIKSHFKESDNNPFFHNHVEINNSRILNNQKTFIPDYIFVYYIQMPEIMEKEDGVLYILGENKRTYWIRPEEDDLFIMKGNISHAPNEAPKSKLNRIVLAGNLKFNSEKKQISLI